VDIAQVSAFRLVIYRTQRFAYRASRIGWNKVLLWALVAVGAGLRLSLIVGQRFHGDEAIYGYWAQLVASGQDPLLISVPLDKPPLFIYLLAGVFRLLGPTEVAARLINQAASVAAVPLTYWLGRRLYTRQAALMAAAMMALSPFNILFAPTAFTDPFMVALILAAMALAADGRCGWAGLLAGLAVATKQQGLFFVPLIFTQHQAASGEIQGLGYGPNGPSFPECDVAGNWLGRSAMAAATQFLGTECRQSRPAAPGEWVGVGRASGWLVDLAGLRVWLTAAERHSAARCAISALAQPASSQRAQ
jgi:hypothetical protein